MQPLKRAVIPRYTAEMVMRHQIRMKGKCQIIVDIRIPFGASTKHLKIVTFNFKDLELALRTPNVVINALERLCGIEMVDDCQNVDTNTECPNITHRSNIGKKKVIKEENE